MVGDKAKVASDCPQPTGCTVCSVVADRADGCLWPDATAISEASARRFSVPSDRVVTGEGVQPAAVWIVQSGLLRVQRYSFDGRRQILSLVLPGEVVGYDLQGRDGLVVESATPCTLCQIDRRLFEKRMEDSSDVRRAMYLQQLNQLDRLRWLTWAIGVLTPEERLCAFLALATRFMPFEALPEGGGVLTIQISRADIADLLGTTVESISRITHRLQDEGCLEIHNPERFRIVDLQRLIEMGQIEPTFAGLPFQGNPPSKPLVSAGRGRGKAKPGEPEMTAINASGRTPKIVLQ